MKSAVASFVVGLFAFVGLGPAVAAPSVSAAAPTQTPRAFEIETPAFRSFVDGVAEGQMQAQSVPGLSMAVVTPSAVYINAYGIGSREGEAVALSPDQLVPLASVSKAFIAVALMRAVEQGKIELDAPASKYLDFEIPQFPGAREITVHDLATHEAGFEERWVSTGAGRADETRSFGQLLAQTAPNVIAPPGTYQSYSNYGSALLAYVVERAMGKPYYTVLQSEVLVPLGMDSTTIEAPDADLLAPFEDRIVAGWKVSGGVVRPDQAFRNVRTYPSGRMLSTPGDMARFMRMILANGMLENGQRYLSEQSIETLLTPRRRVDPRMTSVGVIFAEKDINGHRFVGHGGDGGAHHVDMVISRDLGLGIFVDFLSAPGPQARDYFTRTVLGALAPPVAPPTDAAQPPADLERYAGAYRHYRWAFTTIEKMLQLTSEFKVSATQKGTLVVSGRLGPGEYAPVDSSGLFRHLVTGELLFLAPGYRGRMTLNHGTFPFVTAYKLEPWETQAFNGKAYWTFVIGLTALGVVSAAAAFTAFRRAASNAAAIGAAAGFVGLSLSLLGCGLGFYAFVSIAQSLSELDVQAGPPAIANLLLGIPIIAILLSVGYVIGAATNITRPLTLSGGALSTVSLAALAAFLTYLQFWHGIGWNFP